MTSAGATQPRARITAPPARPARARAARPRPRSRPRARTRERHVEGRHHASGPRREQHHAVRQQHRLLDVVRDQQHGPRLARQRLGQPALRLRARQRVQRRERLVEAEHAAARPAACAGTPRAGASRRYSSRRPGALEALEPERGEVRVRRRARPRLESPATRRASAALSSALSHGSSPSRCGISAAGGAATVPASGASSPQTSSSSVDFPQPLGPTTATPRRAATRRSTPSSASDRPERLAHAGERHAGLNVTRLRLGSLETRSASAPSAGITPQVRRVSARRALSQPGDPPSPPVLTTIGA